MSTYTNELKLAGITDEEIAEIKKMFWSNGVFGWGAGYDGDISVQELRPFIGKLVKVRYPQYRPSFETTQRVFNLEQTVSLLVHELEVAKTHEMLKKSIKATPLMNNVIMLMCCILFLFFCIAAKIAALFKYL